MVIAITIAVYVILALLTMFVSARYDFTDTVGTTFFAGLSWPAIVPTWIIILTIVFVIAPIFTKYVEKPMMAVFDWARRACPECGGPNDRHKIRCSRNRGEDDAQV